MRIKKQGEKKKNVESAVAARAAGHVREQSEAKHPWHGEVAHSASRYVMPELWVENCCFDDSSGF